MRWVTYSHPGDDTERVGILLGSVVHGLAEGISLLDLLRSGSMSAAGLEATNDADEVVQLDEVELLAPVPRPPSIRDFISFEAHLRNARASTGRGIEAVWYEHPCFYFTNPSAVIGPHARVAIFPGSAAFDFELEIAAIVGREGSDIPPSQAGDHIAGYTIMCDWSARDLQRAEGALGLGPAKGKDGAISLGPWLVTPEELRSSRSERGYDLSMSVSVNGRRVGGGNWADIHWSFEQMLSYASRGTRVVPGDVLGSGTVGTGCLVELKALAPETNVGWLADGDEVELAVAGLGELVTTVSAPKPGVLALPDFLRS